LIIPMMLAVAGLVASWATAADALPPALLLAVLLTATLVAAHFGFGVETFSMAWSPRSLIVALVCACSIALLALCIPSILIRVSLAGVACAAFLLLSAVGTPSWSVYGRQCVLRAAEFAMILDFESMIQRRPGRQTFVWLGPDEAEVIMGSVCGNRLPYFTESFASLGFPTLGTSNQSAERLDETAIAGVGPGDQVIALAFDERQIDSLKQRFQRGGKTLVDVLDKRRVFEGRELAFVVLAASK
jgi:hypothetical protein